MPARSWRKPLQKRIAFDSNLLTLVTHMIMQARTVPRRNTLRRNLTAMNADGFSFSVMVGIAETYLPAFVLARGLGDLTAAMVATVPVLLGSLLQLLAPFGLQKLRSYRRFVVTTATLQACSMLMLMGMALTDHIPAWSVFVPATLYWAAGLATGPAWNTWVEQLVPKRIRSGFFAGRSRMCHIGVLLGLITGGLALRWSVAHDLTVEIFAVLFGVGAIGRFTSAIMLARQTEVLHSVPANASGIAQPVLNRVSAKDRLTAVMNTIRHPGEAGRLVLFLMAVQTAVHVSGPYFSPFMLKVLNMSWVDYMSLLSLGFLGKMLSLPWAGRFANRWGTDRLLWVGTVGIVPISALWYFSQNFWFLAFVQILSGLVWGCYELAMLLQFFRQIPGQQRVAVLTVYNLGNSAAMVAGTFIGAFILNTFGRDHDAYLTVFVASGLFRFAALLALPGRRTAVRTTQAAVKTLIRTVPVAQLRMRGNRPATVSAIAAGTNIAAVVNERTTVSPILVASRTGDSATDASVVLVSGPAREDSSVSSRSTEGGSGGSRRRDGQSAVRLPARVDTISADELAPGE
jgi:MFS family permease